MRRFSAHLLFSISPILLPRRYSAVLYSCFEAIITPVISRILLPALLLYNRFIIYQAIDLVYHVVTTLLLYRIASLPWLALLFIGSTVRRSVTLLILSNWSFRNHILSQTTQAFSASLLFSSTSILDDFLSLCRPTK